MIKTKTNKKLTLSTETVVKLRDNLTDEQLRGAVGGVLPKNGSDGSSTNGGNC